MSARVAFFFIPQGEPAQTGVVQLAPSCEPLFTFLPSEILEVLGFKPWPTGRMCWAGRVFFSRHQDLS
jgi:hypothetical protein